MNNNLNLHKFLEIMIPICFKVGEIQKELSLSENKIEVNFKNGNIKDPLTIVDLLSQLILKNGIINTFKNINIVGEEDNSKFEISNDFRNYLEKYDLKLNNFDKLKQYNNLADLNYDIKDLVIFLDPLDGTNSYINKKLENVSLLIGVSYKGMPICGIIYKYYDLDNSKNLYYSYKGLNKVLKIKWIENNNKIDIQNIFEIDSNTINNNNKDIRFSNSSRNTSNIDKELLKKLSKNLHIKFEGAGNKITKILNNKLDIYYNCTNCISKWDIICGDIFLKEVGGDLFNYNFENYNYIVEENYSLNKGLIAVSNKYLKELMINLIKEINN